MSESKRMFRDPDDKKIGGVCSGLAHFIDMDVALVRAIFLIALLFIGGGLCAYLIMLVAIPEAKTQAEKCEMMGLPPTPENLQKFTNSI